MQTISIILGGTTYAVPPAPIKRAREWRAKLRAPIDDITALLSTDMAAINDWKALAEKALPVLLGITDTLLDLVYAYAPALKTQQDQIEADGYDEEVVDAFLAILKVAFPLGRLTSLLGPEKPATLMSLPVPSGDSTPPSLTS